MGVFVWTFFAVGVFFTLVGLTWITSIVAQKMVVHFATIKKDTTRKICNKKCRIEKEKTDVNKIYEGK